MAVKEITGAEFEQAVLQAAEPVLVDFWAPWCGPCAMQGPVVEEVSEETTAVSFVKVNVDACTELAQRYGIMSIPTLLVFKDGKIAGSHVGFLDKQHLKEFLGV